MIKALILLQDLRRRIYVKAKADTFCGVHPGDFRTSVGDDGVGTGCTTPCGWFGGRWAQQPLPKVVPAR